MRKKKIMELIKIRAMKNEILKNIKLKKNNENNK